MSSRRLRKQKSVPGGHERKRGAICGRGVFTRNKILLFLWVTQVGGWRLTSDRCWSTSIGRFPEACRWSTGGSWRTKRHGAKRCLFCPFWVGKDSGGQRQGLRLQHTSFCILPGVPHHTPHPTPPREGCHRVPEAAGNAFRAFLYQKGHKQHQHPQTWDPQASPQTWDPRK